MPVHIKGLAELQRKFRQFDADVKKEIRKELREIAQPMAREIRAREVRFGARTASGIAAGSRGANAVVRQRRGKTTGKRPDFGRLQYRTAFVPAIKHADPKLVAEMARRLERLAARFNS